MMPKHLYLLYLSALKYDKLDAWHVDGISFFYPSGYVPFINNPTKGLIVALNEEESKLYYEIVNNYRTT